MVCGITGSRGRQDSRGGGRSLCAIARPTTHPDEPSYHKVQRLKPLSYFAAEIANGCRVHPIPVEVGCIVDCCSSGTYGL